ncbi:hypothetical protein RU95_GL000053 [Enterococcus avium]|nr:hypothetical protein RU95_GL000053 [Enterococcus avium]
MGKLRGCMFGNLFILFSDNLSNKQHRPYFTAAKQSKVFF